MKLGRTAHFFAIFITVSPLAFTSENIIECRRDSHSFPFPKSNGFKFLGIQIFPKMVTTKGDKRYIRISLT